MELPQQVRSQMEFGNERKAILSWVVRACRAGDHRAARGGYLRRAMMAQGRVILSFIYSKNRVENSPKPASQLNLH